MRNPLRRSNGEYMTVLINPQLRDNSVQEYLVRLDRCVTKEFMQRDQHIVERNVWNTIWYLGIPGFADQRQNYADVDWIYDGID